MTEPKDERRAGTTPLKGRPLDDNGAIAFEPSNRVIPPEPAALHIINAHALEPGKIYVFEVDRAKINQEQLQQALNYLGRRGIDGVVIRSIGGDGLRVVGPQPDWMMQVGVEGHRFDPHPRNRFCDEAGCQPARQEEIPSDHRS